MTHKNRTSSEHSTFARPSCQRFAMVTAAPTLSCSQITGLVTLKQISVSAVKSARLVSAMGSARRSLAYITMADVQIVPIRRQLALHFAHRVGTATLILRSIELTFVSGDANWVVECHGSAVNEGDFCCSVDLTTSTCCNTASNGLGLVLAVSSAQAVSATSVAANPVRASPRSGTTTLSSSGSLASMHFHAVEGFHANI